MWFPKSMSWWIKQNVALRNLKSSPRRRKSSGPVERLEDRTLLSVTSSLVGTEVTFTGDATSDVLELRVNGAGHIEFFGTSPGSFSEDLDPAPGVQTLDISAATHVIVNLDAGQDEFEIDNGGAGGFFGNLSLLDITYDGGADGDRLTLINGTVGFEKYTPGPNPGEGNISVISTAPTRSFLLNFQNLDPASNFIGSPVFDNMTGPLMIEAGPADNAISYTATPFSTATGMVTVDDFALINFINKSTLTIDGQGGDDTISLNNPNTPTGLTDIIVNGGDPTASDTLIVNGTTGQDTVTIDQLTLDGARVTGLGPTITATTVEHLIFDGNGGSDALTVTTPAGEHVITLDEGTVADEGVISIRAAVTNGGSPIIPVAFTQLGTNGSLAFADVSNTRVDDLTIHGTDSSDQFSVSATGGITSTRFNTINTVVVAIVPITTPGVGLLDLVGFAGDDTFSVPGNHPFTGGLSVDGGDPSASDTLNFLGSGGTVTAYPYFPAVNEGATQYVTWLGVEHVNLFAGAGSIVVASPGTDHAIDVTPTGAGVGTFTDSASPNTDYSYATVGSVTFFGTGAFDGFNVHGDDGPNAITLTATTATVDAGTVTFGTGLDQFNILGQGGDDTLTVDVTDEAGATNGIIGVPVTFDGGLGSDTLVVTGNPGAVDEAAVDSVIYSPGPTVGQGRLAY
ncbi:MAG: Alkaline phosphatase, partial [Planctomycetaceae bacterium]|nr:Alkaline phosphatase [Planctomycetaceae bacterium]